MSLSSTYYKIAYLNEDDIIGDLPDHTDLPLSLLRRPTLTFNHTPVCMSWAEEVEEFELLSETLVIPPWSFEMPAAKGKKNNDKAKDKNKKKTATQNKGANARPAADSDNDSVFESQNTIPLQGSAGNMGQEQSSYPTRSRVNEARGDQIDLEAQHSAIQRNLLRLVNEDIGPNDRQDQQLPQHQSGTQTGPGNMGTDTQQPAAESEGPGVEVIPGETPRTALIFPSRFVIGQSAQSQSARSQSTGAIELVTEQGLERERTI